MAIELAKLAVELTEWERLRFNTKEKNMPARETGENEFAVLFWNNEGKLTKVHIGSRESGALSSIMADMMVAYYNQVVIPERGGTVLKQRVEYTYQ